jgi:hypothetical protein
MALVTLQTIFHDAFPAYEQCQPLPAHVRRAARAIMPGQTAALSQPVPPAPWSASGPTRVGSGRGLKVRRARPSAGWPCTAPGC